MSVTSLSTRTETAQRRGALAVLSMAQFLVALDYSIVYVALPSIARDLRLEPALAQWVISAYAVLFAGFLMVGGRLVDRIGAKRVFLVALALFAVSSGIASAAQGGAILLAARGAQGLGAALLQPAVLGLLGATFPAGPSRSRALAVWGSVGATGLAAGAILGGLLTAASWRFTFFVNVPLALLCALGAVRWFGHARATARTSRGPALASVLGTGAVLALVAGLSLGAERGWNSTAVRILLGLALLLALGFLQHERVARNVLIDRSLRRPRSLGIGSVATALYMASVGSEFYLLTLLLQSLKGYTPLQAGLAFLPLAMLVTLGSAAAGRAVRRFSEPAVLIGGFTVAAIGLALLALSLGGESYVVSLLPGLLISGFGHGVIYTSMFIIGTRDVPLEHQGTAGALLTTSQYLAGAVAVAILTLLLGASPHSGSFAAAFLFTAAAAAAGIVLIAVERRRLAISHGVPAETDAREREALPQDVSDVSIGV